MELNAFSILPYTVPNCDRAFSHLVLSFIFNQNFNFESHIHISIQKVISITSIHIHTHIYPTYPSNSGHCDLHWTRYQVEPLLSTH